MASEAIKMFIRRNIITHGFLVPGYVLNVSLLIILAESLNREHFGILYAFMSLINIWSIPASIITVICLNTLIQKFKILGSNNRFEFLHSQVLHSIKIAFNAMLFVTAFCVFTNLIGVKISTLWIIGINSIILLFLMEFLKALFLGADKFFLLRHPNPNVGF